VGMEIAREGKASCCCYGGGGGYPQWGKGGDNRVHRESFSSRGLVETVEKGALRLGFSLGKSEGRGGR